VACIASTRGTPESEATTSAAAILAAAAVRA